MKSEGEVQEWAYKITPPLLVAVMIVFAITSIWTPWADSFVADRWFSGITPIYILPILAIACAWKISSPVRNRRDGSPFVPTVGLLMFTRLALLASTFPYVVP